MSAVFKAQYEGIMQSFTGPAQAAVCKYFAINYT